MFSRIIHGDAYEELSKISKRSVNLVFCDPPYNFSVDYGSGKSADSLPAEEYLARMEHLIRLCVDLLTETGCIWFLIPERWADQIGAVLSTLLIRRNRIIWRETFGQYGEYRFPSGHRHLFYHVRSEKHSPFNTESIRVPSARMMAGDKRAAGPRVPDDVWEIPRLVGNARERIGKHPCQLPEDLLRRVILCSTNPGDVVLDPTAGTGTTLRVAQKFGRKYIGIEQQQEYVELIEKRLNQSHQQELFLR